MKNIKILIVVLAIVFGLFLINSYNKKPLGVAEPKPSFSVNMEGCKFDGSKEGVFSFFFDISVKDGKTRLPAQFILKTKDVYAYDYNITSEFKLDRVYRADDEIDNVSFVIDNIYEDYMYFPNENFNIEVFYCEFTEDQKEYLKNMPLHEALDAYCLSVYDYPKVHEGLYIHAVAGHPGEQCTAILRDKDGNVKVYEAE